MEGIGLGSYPHDIDFLNVHKLKEDLPQLEEDAAKLRSFIRQRVKSIVMHWREQCRLIFNCKRVENVESI